MGTNDDAHHGPVLDEVVARVRRTVQPDRIVLFGSRARGQGRPGSDFDLLVVMPSTQPRYRRAGPVCTALAGLRAEADVVVYTPEEVGEWREVPQAFVTTALREGRVLYERRG